MVKCGLRCFAILERRAWCVLMSQSGVRKSVKGSGGPVRAHRSGAKPVNLGLLLLLAFKVGIVRLDVDIVVHVMGI